MNRDDQLRAYIMHAAMTEELPFHENDIVPLGFFAKADMGTGAYYDIE